tara:strand:- start:395 stop:826 length:432 start_codon:yes stop_codon:yes gene_type:complete
MAEKFIGIVGSSTAEKPEANQDNIAKSVHSILMLYDKSDTCIVSGGGEGVDTIAITVAKQKGFSTLEYPPTSKNWEEYKKRNLQIANKCEKIYSIALALGTSKGWRKNVKCYHCKNAGKDTNHEKTAGCYTGKANGNYEVIVV